MNDERLKQLMEQVGMPNSRSLYQALQQAEAEGAASRDAEVSKLKDDNEHLYIAAIERDQLREHVTMLRDALLTCSVGDFSTGHVIPPSFDEKLVDEALAATEPR